MKCYRCSWEHCDALTYHADLMYFPGKLKETSISIRTKKLYIWVNFQEYSVSYCPLSEEYSRRDYRLSTSHHCNGWCTCNNKQLIHTYYPKACHKTGFSLLPDWNKTFFFRRQQQQNSHCTLQSALEKLQPESAS